MVEAPSIASVIDGECTLPRMLSITVGKWQSQTDIPAVSGNPVASAVRACLQPAVVSGGWRISNIFALFDHWYRMTASLHTYYIFQLDKLFLPISAQIHDVNSCGL